MNITAEHTFGIRKDRLGIVGKNNLHLGATLFYQFFIVFHIVHTSEHMFLISKILPVFFLRKHVRPGIHTRSVQNIQINKMVAHLVRRVTQHQDHLAAALSDTLKANSKTVPAEDGEDQAQLLCGELSSPNFPCTSAAIWSI